MAASGGASLVFGYFHVKLHHATPLDILIDYVYLFIYFSELAIFKLLKKINYSFFPSGLV